MKKYSFLLIMINIIILITACSGYIRLEKIQATDYFSGIKCEIPLSVPSALPTSEYLHTNDSVEELKNKLVEKSRDRDRFIIEYLPYNALMIICSEDSKNAIYLLHEYSTNVETSYEHKYRFSDLCSILYVDTNDCNIRGIKGIPIPHYLFIEMTSGDY